MAEIMKRKRTKRPRHPSPLALAMASTSSNIPETATARVGATVRTSPSTSADEFTDSTEEEEDMADMANCLILLAQSRVKKSPQPTTSPSNSSAAGTAVSSGGRLYVYQCKTCDRCFSSFQALGGHRASHNKPKSGVNGEEKKQFADSLMREDADRFSHENSTALSLQILPNRGISANKSKIHECGICGAEFSSGQALGGHMRRHRQIPALAAATNSDDLSQEVKKSRTVLALDLNLPAPEDDHRESKFGFASKELIVFSASSLVDCHY